VPDLSRASDYKAARIRPWTSTTPYWALLEFASDARPASPITSGLARDGYLTGVVVAPQPVPVLRWLAPLLADSRRFIVMPS